MPLILLCGLPCTGKTTFAARLASFLNDNGLGTVEIINEESEGIVKRDGHSTSANEKSTRGLLKSRVVQKLNADKVVIVDYLNYIKGFRYELHCIAKTFRTPHCLVWVQCDEVTSNQWNSERKLKGDSFGIDDSILYDLRRRFEVPNEKNRWDSPLFIVNMTPSIPSSEITKSESIAAADSNFTLGVKLSSSPSSSPPQSSPPSTHENTTLLPSTPPPPPPLLESKAKSAWKPKKKQGEASPDPSHPPPTSSPTSSPIPIDPPIQAGNDGLYFSGTLSSVLSFASHASEPPQVVLPKIVDFFKHAIAPTPNASTRPIFHAEADLLYELDSTSQKIVEMIMFHQNQGHEGTPLIFHEYNRTLELHRPVGIAELQRHRRQFVKVNSFHPPGDSVNEIGTKFIEFLGSQL